MIFCGRMDVEVLGEPLESVAHVGKVILQLLDYS